MKNEGLSEKKIPSLKMNVHKNNSKQPSIIYNVKEFFLVVGCVHHEMHKQMSFEFMKHTLFFACSQIKPKVMPPLVTISLAPQNWTNAQKQSQKWIEAMAIISIFICAACTK